MCSIINLAKLLFYFEELNTTLKRIYPEEITWENVYDYNYKLDVKHPDWVEAHFPLVIIYHKEKAGKLRDSKNVKIMYQNNFNILTQLVWTANNFWAFHRKNRHKGFKDIVGAIQGDWSDRTQLYHDMQKPKKYKNFGELHQVYAPEDNRLRIMCEVLSENYTCDSTGQLRLI